MKLCYRVAAAVVAAFLVMLGFSGAASAQPRAYPPTSCSTVLVASTVVPPGGALPISGSGFTPGAHLTIEWHPGVTILGHVTADAQGKFSTTVHVPADAAAGSHLIEVTGGGEVCPIDPIQVTVKNTHGEHTPPPSMTGVAIASLLGLAALLLAFGFWFQDRGRAKRKGQTHAKHRSYEPRHEGL